jgi:transposase
VETNATRMCERLVGLPDVNVLAVEDQPGQPIEVHVETHCPRPSCPACSGPVVVKDRPPVQLGGSAVLRAPARLVWRKHRWACRTRSCPVGSWTASDERIASARMGRRTGR